MPNRNQNDGQTPISKSEKDELLLRLALTERKLSLALQKLEARNKELAAINRLSETIGSERQINRLSEKTAEVICRTLGVETVCILLLEKHTGDLVTAASRHGAIAGAYHPRVKAGDGPLWQAMMAGKPLPIPGSAAAKQFAGHQSGKAGIAIPIRSRESTIGVIYACGKKNGQEFSARERDMLCGISNQAAFALDNANLYHDLENLFVGIAWSFASALDAKSHWTAGHSKRVTQYSVAIAEEMGQTTEFVNRIQACGLLHDIGKIAIPEEILDKPGAITKQERLTIAEHASQGARILEHIDHFQPILPGIRHHHERWDGRGFPDKLRAADIPLMARVLAVADSYDAMTSDRPYRQRRNRRDALAEIQRCSGSQFDPQVVEAFIEVAGNRTF